MPFTYPQVSINGTAYDAYVTVDAADAYMNASVNSAAWDALAVDDKGRAIITAVRVIDSISWKGEKTEADNALAWPRTCMDGDPPGTLPAALVTANIQLAFAISQNPEMVAAGQVGQNGTKMLKAGSVEIQYFNTGVSIAQANASAIWSILAPLADCIASAGSGAGLLTGAYASGTSRPSPFQDPDYSFVRGV